MREILQSKIAPPQVQRVLVSRPRLVARLNEGPAGKLILVSAPAGYGKSTLVATWLAGLGRTVYGAWLALDQGDNDLGRFLTHLAAAVQRAAPHLQEPIEFALAAGSEGETTPADFAPLLNTLSVLDRQLVLVFDDYHLIRDCSVHGLLVSLLDHLPQTVTIVVSTRMDPPLPLARLRAQGRLTSFRAADLSFSLVEASDYLRLVMKLDLTEVAVASLTRRTEGWITGLQLAALSLQRQQDVEGFLQEFAGDDRNVRSYLLDEALAGQPTHVRQFLLVTSILERLTAPLCSALMATATGESPAEEAGQQMTAQEILEYLEERNLFIVPLDEHGEWYRYHRLFAELLRFQLWSEQRTRLPAIHRRAALWLEQHGFVDEAVRQALSVGDTTLAEAIELRQGQPSGLAQQLTMWLKRLYLGAFQRPAASPGVNGHQFALGRTGGVEVARALEAATGRRQRLSSPPLPCEQLSEREEEVLALLAEGLSYREIGQRLVISLPTVKSHISHIYGKLDVHSREEAVGRASKLGLLAIE